MEAQRDSLTLTSKMKRMLKTLSRNQERSLTKETLELIMPTLADQADLEAEEVLEEVSEVETEVEAEETSEVKAEAKEEEKAEVASVEAEVDSLAVAVTEEVIEESKKRIS